MHQSPFPLLPCNPLSAPLHTPLIFIPIPSSLTPPFLRFSKLLSSTLSLPSLHYPSPPPPPFLTIPPLSNSPLHSSPSPSTGLFPEHYCLSVSVCQVSSVRTNPLLRLLLLLSTAGRGRWLGGGGQSQLEGGGIVLS